MTIPDCGCWEYEERFKIYRKMVLKGVNRKKRETYLNKEPQYIRWKSRPLYPNEKKVLDNAWFFCPICGEPAKEEK